MCRIWSTRPYFRLKTAAGLVVQACDTGSESGVVSVIVTEVVIAAVAEVEVAAAGRFEPDHGSKAVG